MVKISEGEFDRQLDIIEAQFLCCKPIEQIDWMTRLLPGHTTSRQHVASLSKQTNFKDLKLLRV